LPKVAIFLFCFRLNITEDDSARNILSSHMAFSFTIGQNNAKSALERSLKSKQVPHAQCFIDHGGRGGLALALDCALHLLYPEIPDSLEKALQHPDLHFVYPVTTSDSVKSKPLCADYLPDWRNFLKEDLYGSLTDWLYRIGSDNKQGNIGVEETERLFKSLSLKAYLGKNKVCVLWGLERLNIQAANKLLKLIEEPPKNTYFILVVEDADALLPTIKSRCQELSLPPLRPSEIKGELMALEIDELQANEIAQNAGGNLQWAKQQVLQGEETKEVEALLIECLRCAFKAGGNKAISIELMQWANKAGQMGRPFQKAFLRYGLAFIRQALLLSYQTTPIVTFRSFNNFSLEKFAPFVHSKNAHRLIQLFEESIYSIERNANGKILFTDFCLQLTRLLNTKEA